MGYTYNDITYDICKEKYCLKPVFLYFLFLACPVSLSLPGSSIGCSNMKVNKVAQEKGHGASSLKWKNSKAKRCRPPVINPSELNTSPVMVKMIKEHQAAVKKKPKVKRLKKKAKTLPESKKNIHTSYECEKPYPNTNGSLAVTMNNESDDWQEWSANGEGTLGNGEKAPDGVETVGPGRLEGDSLHYCAERDEDRNHAVLVMQKAQVCNAP